jgi:N-6 DNA Methylase
MLPGFGGHLISEAFLESHLGSQAAGAAASSNVIRARLDGWRRQTRMLGPATTVRALLEMSATPLFDALGFGAAWRIDVIDDRAAAALLTCGDRPLTLVVGPWGEPLERLWRPAVTHAVGNGADWCLLFNGTHLRIVDAVRLYWQRHVEFDLELALDDERTFSALCCVASADRFTADQAPDALRVIVAASERHGVAVCRSLKDGVLAASAAVLDALVGGRRITRGGEDKIDAFEQALTIVYRLLFLLFAEARGLVPLWHPVYRDSYSVEALRLAAEGPRPARGLWDALRAIARLAHSGCVAGDLRVTPFNGRLFAPARTPLAERRSLDDEGARRAVLAVSTRPSRDRTGRERIAYRDLGVEQLGAVYEALLDYEPRIHRCGATLEPGAGLRKSTGTFYTPQPLADYLIRHTLAPLLDDATPESILTLKIVDPAMGSGAFLVAACNHLAAAYESALIRAGGCDAADLGHSERASIRRTIAERCLYGVDANPMAVQLARLSLWLATLAADRPLTFLDHHLASGDSLLGAWLTSIRTPPAQRRRRTAADASLALFRSDGLESALQAVLPVRFNLEAIPDDTLEQVRAKERAVAALARRDSQLSKWKRIADLWCASWFSGRLPASAFGALSDAIMGPVSALPPPTVASCLREAESIATLKRFFHWELEFPEVFFENGAVRRPAPGFDAVVGNPPWDMIRADAGPPLDRLRLRDDVSATIRFTRDAGIYSAQSDGHANRYQLFLERAIALAKPGGRIGLVLPSGLATDSGSARLRRRLFTACDVDAIVGFDNRRAVFPIHRSVRFLLLTATAGAPTRTIACRLGEQDPAALERLDDERARSDVPVTPAWLERVSGPGLTIPDLRTAIDVQILDRACALFLPLGDGRGWAARFGRELNATDDRDVFRPAEHGLPIVEGKQVHPFRVDAESARHAIARADALRLLGPSRFDRPRLAYRDVASATNRQTLVAAILPAGCVSTHTVFCLRSKLPIVSQHFLCGLFNTFVVNYLVRLRVATHVTTAIVERLPIPRREDAPRTFREIAALARVLRRRDDSVAAAKLHALTARLYQLTPAEFEYVLATFPLVPRAQRDAARRAYEQMHV